MNEWLLAYHQLFCSNLKIVVIFSFITARSIDSTNWIRLENIPSLLDFRVVVDVTS